MILSVRKFVYLTLILSVNYKNITRLDEFTSYVTRIFSDRCNKRSEREIVRKFSN